jgi:hypothetical protein
MDEPVAGERLLPQQQTSRTRLVTPRRIAAVLGLVVLAITLRRQLRFARDVFRHRRRLRLAFTLLVFLRQLRNSRAR